MHARRMHEDGTASMVRQQLKAVIRYNSGNGTVRPRKHDRRVTFDLSAQSFDQSELFQNDDTNTASSARRSLNDHDKLEAEKEESTLDLWPFAKSDSDGWCDLQKDKKNNEWQTDSKVLSASSKESYRRMDFTAGENRWTQDQDGDPSLSQLHSPQSTVGDFAVLNDFGGNTHENEEDAQDAEEGHRTLKFAWIPRTPESDLNFSHYEGGGGAANGTKGANPDATRGETDDGERQCMLPWRPSDVSSLPLDVCTTSAISFTPALEWVLETHFSTHWGTTTENSPDYLETEGLQQQRHQSLPRRGKSGGTVLQCTRCLYPPLGPTSESSHLNDEEKQGSVGESEGIEIVMSGPLGVVSLVSTSSPAAEALAETRNTPSPPKDEKNSCIPTVAVSKKRKAILKHTSPVNGNANYFSGLTSSKTTMQQTPREGLRVLNPNRNPTSPVNGIANCFSGLTSSKMTTQQTPRVGLRVLNPNRSPTNGDAGAVSGKYVSRRTRKEAGCLMHLIASPLLVLWCKNKTAVPSELGGEEETPCVKTNKSNTSNPVNLRVQHEEIGPSNLLYFVGDDAFSTASSSLSFCDSYAEEDEESTWQGTDSATNSILDMQW